MQKNSNTLRFYSSEVQTKELLLKLQSNSKRYTALLSALKQLGNFDNDIETYLSDTKETNRYSYMRIGFFDKDGNHFTIYATSSEPKDLTIIEKQTSNSRQKYDFLLAKGFPITSENIDYFKTEKQYSFKSGRLITDNKTFYSIYLGDNVGFQLEINYANPNQTVNTQELISQLNKLNTKLTMHVFLNIFHQLIETNKITFLTIRITAYKDFKKLADFVIDNEEPQEAIVIRDIPPKPSPQTSEAKEEKTTTKSLSIMDDIEEKKLPKKPIKKRKNPPKKEVDKMDAPTSNLMTKEHYNRILDEIKDLNDQRNEVNSGRKDAWDAGAGDGWDSFEFEDIERKERLIISQIEYLKKILANATIIEKQDNEELIDIDDVIRLAITSDNKTDEYYYKLTGSGEIGIKEDGMTWISVNSPIGKAIYHKKVGDKTSYQVKDRHGSQTRVFHVDILEKVNSKSGPNVQL